MLKWLTANKDALVALAALSSPIIVFVGTIIGTFVSYKAAIAGPRMQRMIAEDAAKNTGRQIDIQAQTLRLTAAQASASMLASAEQKWLEEFRNVMAELISLTNDSAAMDTAQLPGNLGAQLEWQKIDATRRRGVLSQKVLMMVGLDGAGGSLNRKLSEWSTEKDKTKRIEKGREAVLAALKIVSDREKAIRDRVDDIIFLDGAK